MSTRIPLIFGAGMIGYPGTETRVQDPVEVQKFIDTFVAHGQVGIDTARTYGGGTSEKMLGTMDLRGKARIDTKMLPVLPGDHAPEKLKETFQVSLEALGAHKVRAFYLHKPDHATPFEQTLEAVNDLYNEGLFELFGLSNYMSWEVAEIVGICERRGFVKPTVYEGIYNLLDRTPEGELFPCLRKFGIRFSAYTVLAGGYLTGKHLPAPPAASAPAENNHPFSHFNPGWCFSGFYSERYPPMAAAVTKLQGVVARHGLTLTEVAYRWLQWHSLMRPGDFGLIVGASTVTQLETALNDCAKGPLPDEVVQACEQTWREVRGVAKNYWLEGRILDKMEETNSKNEH